VRVATWNVRHGRPRRGFTSNRSLAGAVERLGADVLALQEVERGVVRSWFADQPALAGRAGHADAVEFAPARRLALIGHDGVALCVRGRIDHVRVLELPREHIEQQWVAIVAGVVVDQTVATVVTTHLHNDAPVARLQLDALLDDISGEPSPRLLLGDLNLRPEDVEAPLRAAGFKLVDAGFTSPAWAPVQRIDHVAMDGFVPGDVSVPTVAVSDHRPVLVDVRPAR